MKANFAPADQELMTQVTREPRYQQLATIPDLAAPTVLVLLLGCTTPRCAPSRLPPTPNARADHSTSTSEPAPNGSPHTYTCFFAINKMVSITILFF